jgi:hypothetical protein
MLRRQRAVFALACLRQMLFPSRAFVIRINERGIERKGRGWAHGCLPWPHIARDRGSAADG